MFRARREFPAGPQGIFLKRASGGLRVDGAGGFPWLRRVAEDERAHLLREGVRLPAGRGAVRARSSARAGCWSPTRSRSALALVLAYLELRHAAPPGVRRSPRPCRSSSATVAPLYLVWPTPELFNLGLSRPGPLRLAARAAGAGRGPARHRDLHEALQPAPGPARSVSSRCSARAARTRRSARLARVAAARRWPGRGRRGALRRERGHHGRAELPGRRAQDVLRPLPRGGGRTARVTFGNSGIWMTTDQLGSASSRASDERGESRAHGTAAPAATRSQASFAAQPRLLLGRPLRRARSPTSCPRSWRSLLFLLAGPRVRDGLARVRGRCVVSWLFYIWHDPRQLVRRRRARWGTATS